MGSSMTKVVVESNSLGTGKVTLKAPNITGDIIVELPSLGGPIGGFPPGTAMLFVQTNAPTGWTKSTAHSNKALRVVTGTAGSGGTVDFSTAFTSRAVTGSVSVSGTVGSTALSVEQMPSHAHSFNTEVPGGSRLAWESPTNGGLVQTGSAYVNAAINAAGSGWGHNHSFSGSGSFTGTAIDLSVKYVDVIIATKD